MIVSNFSSSGWSEWLLKCCSPRLRPSPDRVIGLHDGTAHQRIGALWALRVNNSEQALLRFLQLPPQLAPGTEGLGHLPSVAFSLVDVSRVTAKQYWVSHDTRQSICSSISQWFCGFPNCHASAPETIFSGELGFTPSEYGP